MRKSCKQQQDNSYAYTDLSDAEEEIFMPIEKALSPRIPVFVQSQGSKTMKRLSRDLSYLMDGPILTFVRAKWRILTIGLILALLEEKKPLPK